MKLRRMPVPAWPLAFWLVPGLAVLVAVAVTSSGGNSPPAAAPAANQPEPVPTGRDDPRAIALLRAAQRAAVQVPYSGVQYASAWCSSGSASQVVDVTHVPGSGSLVAVHGTPAEAGGAIFTADEASDESSAEPADEPVALLAKNYHVVLAGEAEIAGRPTVVIEARRASGMVAARLWVDKHSGLLLRRELFDHSGRTTKATAFVDVTIGSANMDRTAPATMPTPWSDRVPVGAVATLRAAGWTAAGAIAPGLQLTDIRRLDGDDGPVLHLTYSDGLFAVSVFQQRGHLDVDRLDRFYRTRIAGAEVYVQNGIPLRATWSSAGIVYTVVSDASGEVVEGVIAALPHETRPTGTMARLSHGVDRFASWFNPFG